MAFFGEIRLFAGPTPPTGWAFCDGSTLPIIGYEGLFESIGYRYGVGLGMANSFRLPDLRGRVPVHMGPGIIDTGMLVFGGSESVSLLPDQIPSHFHAAGCSSSAQSTSTTSGALPASGPAIYVASTLPSCALSAASVSIEGTGAPHSNIQPYAAVNYIICISGGVPMVPGASVGGTFSDFGGMVMLSACGDIEPAGMVRADGPLLSRTTFSGLFSLIGTTFGVGDGSTTFGGPNFIGRTFCGVGSGTGLTSYALGDTAGEDFHALTTAELPSHTHKLYGVSQAGDTDEPRGNLLASAAVYVSTAANASFQNEEVAPTGSASAGHETRQPYQGITALIAVDDVSPIALTGEIRIWLGTSVPSGWQLCDGTSLNTTTDAALFAIIGYAFGGSGTTFKVPDLQGRVGVGVGSAPGLSTYSLGDSGGTETVTLSSSQMPAHAHAISAADLLHGFPMETDPTGKLLGTASGVNLYKAAGTQVQLRSDAIQAAGSGDPHENRMKMVAVTFIIKK